MDKLFRKIILSGIAVTMGAGHLAAEPALWAGTHLGLSAAHVKSEVTHTDVNGNFDTAGIEYISRDNVASAFASLGHDWQTGNIVIGAEADIGFLSANATLHPGNPETNEITSDLKHLASLRARLGLAHASSLFYLTGGIAFADLDSQSIYTGEIPLNADGWRKGWVIGAGVEYALHDNWTLSAEALQYEFESTSEYFPGFGTNYREDIDLSPTVMRIGLQYQL